MSEQTEKVLHDLCVRQAKILTEVANILKGPPSNLRHWSHHDLADKAIDVVVEVKRLREALELIKVAEHKGHPMPYATAIANAVLRGEEVRDEKREEDHARER